VRLHFCSDHLHFIEESDFPLCDRCCREEEPFNPKPDTEEWINHQLTDPTWEQWRREEPEAAAQARIQLGAHRDARRRRESRESWMKILLGQSTHHLLIFITVAFFLTFSFTMLLSMFERGWQP
jgi:hypothetical protein